VGGPRAHWDRFGHARLPLRGDARAVHGLHGHGQGLRTGPAARQRQLTQRFPARQGPLAGCPTGKALLGGGARIFPGNGQVVVDGIGLESALQGVRAHGFEDADGTSLRWQVDAFAICSDPLPGLVQVDRTSPANTFDKAAVATCPTGKVLVGAGAETNGGLGQIVIDDLIPSLTKNSVSTFGVHEPGSSLNSKWTITAHAMCANPLPGLELRTLQSDALSINYGVVLSCSAGKKLLGLGGEITHGSGAVLMDDLTPNSTLTGASIGAREVQGGTTTDWTIKGYAICATA
jgi:hypothetical protein